MFATQIFCFFIWNFPKNDCLLTTVRFIIKNQIYELEETTTSKNTKNK